MFFNKKDTITSDDSAEEFKSATESLYKQNLELAVKNKTLSLLSKLYDISIGSLSTEDLAIQLTKVIQNDFAFERVGIYTYNSSRDILRSLAFSESERFHLSRSDADNVFDSIKIDKATEVPFFMNCLNNGVMSYTENIEEIWGKVVSANVIDKIVNSGHVRSSLAYPLVIDDKTIGVLVLSLNRVYHDLVEYEKQAIKSFINVIAVAIDRAYLYEQLQIANEGQANIIHVMNHQIKGYLSKARGIFSELLVEPAYGPVAESAKPMIKEGFDSLTEGVGFIQQVLNGSSAESGKIVYNMKPIDFKTVVTDVVAKQKENAEKKGLTLDVETMDGNYSMMGDEINLREVVRNLIDNSITYTEKGGLHVTLGHKDTKIILTLKDTGVGISNEDMPRLFTKGGRGKDSLRMNVNSTGYGLAFVKGVVEAHKGRVWVESEGKGKGSTFFVEIPV